jgi:syntaxin 1B/2/3
MGRDEYEGRSTAWDRNAPNSPINSPATIGTNVEMEPLTGTGTSFPRQQDPNAILNECRDVDNGIRELEQVIGEIKKLHTAVINNPDSSNGRPAKQLEEATAELMAMYRNLTGRVKNIKQKPESGSPRNAPQVGKVDRDLKDTLQKYRTVEADFTRRLREQAARQYRIVRPDATEAEVQEAIEDPNQQMFSQALMQSDRRGQAQSTLKAVQDRHAAIEKIQQQMIELAELFQDMDNLVVQQEAAVTNIEMKGEEVVENMDKGTEQIGVAIQSARNARKWKWWCLGICGRSSCAKMIQFLSLTKHCSGHYHHHCRCCSYLQVRHPNTSQSHCKALRHDRLRPRPQTLYIWPCSRSK